MYGSGFRPYERGVADDDPLPQPNQFGTRVQPEFGHADCFGPVVRGKRVSAESAFVRAIADRTSDSLTASLNLAVLRYNRGERDKDSAELAGLKTSSEMQLKKLSEDKAAAEAKLAETKRDLEGKLKQVADTVERSIRDFDTRFEPMAKAAE